MNLITPAQPEPPAGCFCKIMDDGSGCLTCTCPDCGAYGRYGAAIHHKSSCS